MKRILLFLYGISMAVGLFSQMTVNKLPNLGNELLDATMLSDGQVVVAEKVTSVSPQGLLLRKVDGAQVASLSTNLSLSKIKLAADALGNAYMYRSESVTKGAYRLDYQQGTVVPFANPNRNLTSFYVSDNGGYMLGGNHASPQNTKNAFSYAGTSFGWLQSSGTVYIMPPPIYGASNSEWSDITQNSSGNYWFTGYDSNNFGITGQVFIRSFPHAILYGASGAVLRTVTLTNPTNIGTRFIDLFEIGTGLIACTDQALLLINADGQTTKVEPLSLAFSRLVHLRNGQFMLTGKRNNRVVIQHIDHNTLSVLSEVSFVDDQREIKSVRPLTNTHTDRVAVVVVFQNGGTEIEVWQWADGNPAVTHEVQITSTLSDQQCNALGTPLANSLISVTNQAGLRMFVPLDSNGKATVRLPRGSYTCYADTTLGNAWVTCTTPFTVQDQAISYDLISHRQCPNMGLKLHSDVACQGNSRIHAITNTLHPNTTWNWSTGATENVIDSAILSQIYTVTVTQGNCYEELGAQINSQMYYNYGFTSVSNVMCAKGGFVLNPDFVERSYGQFTWRSGAPVTTTQFNTLADTTLKFEITNDLGCKISPELRLLRSHLNASLALVPDNCGGLSVKGIGSSSQIKWSWPDGSSGQSVPFTQPSIYTVTASDESCSTVISDSLQALEPIWLAGGSITPNPPFYTDYLGLDRPIAMMRSAEGGYLLAMQDPNINDVFGNTATIILYDSMGVHLADKEVGAWMAESGSNGIIIEAVQPFIQIKRLQAGLVAQTIVEVPNMVFNDFQNLFKDANGDFLLAGILNNQVVVIKISASGTLVWQKMLNGNTLNQQPFVCALDTDSTGIWIAYSTNAPNLGVTLPLDGHFIYMLHVDGNGNLLHERRLGGVYATSPNLTNVVGNPTMITFQTKGYLMPDSSIYSGEVYIIYDPIADTILYTGKCEMPFGKIQLENTTLFGASWRIGNRPYQYFSADGKKITTIDADLPLLEEGPLAFHPHQHITGSFSPHTCCPGQYVLRSIKKYYKNLSPPTLAEIRDTTLCGAFQLTISSSAPLLLSENLVTGSADTIFNQQLPITTTGEYIVIARMPFGCEARDTFIVFDCNAPTLVLPDTISGCGTAIYTLPAGTQNITWSNGSTSPSQLVTYAQTLYLVSATYLGQLYSDSIYFQVDTTNLLGINAQIKKVCHNETQTGEIHLQNLPTNVTLQWSTGDTMAHLTQLTPGAYQLTISTNQGCTRSLSAIVEQTPVFGFGVGARSLPCYTDSSIYYFNAFIGTIPPSPYTFMWSTGAQNDTLIAATGVYTLTLTSADGCTSIRTTPSATLPLPISLNIAQAPVSGSSIQTITANHTGGQSPFTYAWNTTETTRTIQIATSGTYTCTVTDANGCSVMQLIMVQISSTDQINQLTGFEVFPNPSSGQFTLRLADTQMADGWVLRSVLGQVARRGGVKQIGDTVIDGRGLPSGAYALELEKTGQMVARQLVVIMHE
jgi:hypothetical protein